MKLKVLTWFVVLILIAVIFLISTTNVSAEEPPELDNDKNIYFRPSETKEKNYDYNYSSDIYSYL